MNVSQFIQTMQDTDSHIHEMHELIELIQFTHCEYYRWLEDSDLDDINLIKQLIVQAPAIEIKFWLLGKLSEKLALKNHYFERKERKDLIRKTQKVEAVL